MREQQRSNLDKLVNTSSNSGTFWKFYRELADPRPKPPLVSLQSLRDCFQRRMNPDPVPPDTFDRAQACFVPLAAATLPCPSEQSISSQELNAPLSCEDIAWAKAHIERHSPTSSCGLDHVSYKEILEIDNSLLCDLLNKCIQEHDVPLIWLTTRIVGILKKDKPRDKADSYRTVGLESCLLKLLTLLVHKRLYD